MLHPGQHFHIIGVGGSGMSAIARVLVLRGYSVSGSDLRANDFTRELAALGATIHIGHAAANLAGADAVVATSAADDSNPEIAAARAQGIPVLRRRDILSELMADKIGIAVAGTHGKTTTTALIAHGLMEAGLDPTYIVGGVMLNTGANAGVGQGPHFVIEADEYDRMFLGLRPQIAVITTIEHDHPDCFPTMGDTLEAFRAFVDLLSDDGLLVACADDARARALGEARRGKGKRSVFYGVSRGVLQYAPTDGWWADNPEPDAAGGMRFTVWRGEREIGRARLYLSGRHNVQNALAAMAVADQVGVPFETIAAAFESFQGTGRRSEVMGQAGGVTVINDYAHHPTAIRVTLEAHRAHPGIRELWAVWQPHTYGRMRALADDFARAFESADHVLVTDVYSVREQVTPGLDAAGIVAMIQAAGHPDTRYTGSLDATAASLIAGVRPGDVVILLSAGDLPPIGAAILEGAKDHFTAESAEDAEED
jgi:UDP-N-acetylmuramate--alanine ligase